MPKFVTSWSQMAKPEPAKPVKLPAVPGLNTADGEPAQLFARKLTAWNLDEYETSMRDASGQTTAESVRHAYEKFLGATLVDPQGNLLFDEPADAIEALSGYDAPIIGGLYAAVVKAINASVDEKAVARAEKNSGTTPTGDSESGTSVSTS